MRVLSKVLKEIRDELIGFPFDPASRLSDPDRVIFDYKNLSLYDTYDAKILKNRPPLNGLTIKIFCKM